MKCVFDFLPARQPCVLFLGMCELTLTPHDTYPNVSFYICSGSADSVVILPPLTFVLNINIHVVSFACMAATWTISFRLLMSCSIVMRFWRTGLDMTHCTYARFNTWVILMVFTTNFLRHFLAMDFGFLCFVVFCNDKCCPNGYANAGISVNLVAKCPGRFHFLDAVYLQYVGVSPTYVAYDA